MNSFHDIPQPARVFGLAGLLPFVAGALLCWVQITIPIVPDGLTGSFILLSYGAVILSFLGGIRWGVAMQNGGMISNWAIVAWAMMPSLLAWFAIMQSSIIGLPILMLGLVLQLTIDYRSTQAQITPPWFLTLRTLLTLGAIASIAIGWLGVLSV